MSFYAFFDTLFPTQPGTQDQGYVVIARYPTGHFPYGGGIAPDDLMWYAWPSQKESLVAFCLAHSSDDLYTVPALFTNRSHRRADNISHQWVVYADADSLPLEKLRAEPTMVVETSPDRHHVYWTTGTDDPELLCSIGRAIAHTHGDDGCDKGGWDAGQLLRVPGSTNSKYVWEGKDAFEVRLLRQGKPTTAEALASLYPAVAPAIPDADMPMPSAAEWRSDENRAKAAEVFEMVPDIEQIATRDIDSRTDRSAMMWRLLGELARCQIDPVVAMYIAWYAKCNKYRLDGRSHHEMWHELCRAYADPQNRPVTSEFAAIDREKIMELANNPTKQAEEHIRSHPLLTDEERELVRDDTFPDRYTSWCNTRTDAPSNYHRAGATTILSTILGTYARPPLDRSANLTLWFLLLGPTTVARKTTAMEMWVDFVRDLEDSHHTYLLGSNATSEALGRILPRRNGRTSVFFRDEVHGMFDEQDKKRYLAGFSEYLTDLYNGNVPVVLRASDMKKSDGTDDDEYEVPRGKITTNFVMFLCGTIAQVTRALTVEDYESGYLARFLAAHADPPPLTKDRVRMEQSRGETEKTNALLRHELLMEVEQARTFWHEKTNNLPDKPKVYFQDDAWERLQDAMWAMTQAAQSSETLSEILAPTATRMGMSIMKVSILLAMVECREEVEMGDVLKAIQLAEEWYQATVIIGGKIMHTTWAQRQEEIRMKIQSRGGGILESELFAHFRSRFNLRDIETDLEFLIKAGLVTVISENGGRKRYVVTKLINSK